MKLNRNVPSHQEAGKGEHASNWQLALLQYVKTSVFAKTMIGLIVAYYLTAAIGMATGNIDAEWHGWFPILKRVAQIPPVMPNAAERVACIWISGQMTGNKCKDVVTVTSFGAIDAQGHETIMPCTGVACTFPPQATGPLLSPPGLKITRVVSAY